MSVASTTPSNATIGMATVIASLPPPTTGMTLINERIVAELAKRGRVNLVNLSADGAARRRGWKIIRSLRHLRSSLRVLAGTIGDGSLYLALNSGPAVSLDLLLVIAARVRKRRIFFHHHSFRFLDTPSPLLRALYWVGGGNIVDIVLCGRMADGLRNAYGRTDVRVVPNLVENDGTEPRQERGDGPVRLGHLANLSLEKGVGRTIEAFEYSRRQGLDVELHLAGRFANSDAREAVERALVAWPAAIFYHGFVSGSEKAAFYSSLDLFLYPTAYVVEAQPLVLLEALSSGVPVVSVDRGCVSGVAQSAVGDAVSICGLSEFPEVVADAVRRLAGSDTDCRASRRSSATATATAFADLARTAFAAIVEEILWTGGPSRYDGMSDHSRPCSKTM